MTYIRKVMYTQQAQYTAYVHTAVGFVIWSFGAPNGTGRCPVAQCYLPVSVDTIRYLGHALTANTVN